MRAVESPMVSLDGLGRDEGGARKVRKSEEE